jgi:short-subunit dehydrogenase
VQSFSECLYLEMLLKEAPIHVSSIIPGMIKTSIFNADAGAGEPAAAAGHRKAMHDMMAAYGMDLAEGSRVMMEQIAANKFWVSSQPDMTEQTLAGRIEFFQTQADPQIAEGARHLLEH